jgi:hypothetical protein
MDQTLGQMHGSHFGSHFATSKEPDSRSWATCSKRKSPIQNCSKQKRKEDGREGSEMISPFLNKNVLSLPH